MSAPKSEMQWGIANICVPLLLHSWCCTVAEKNRPFSFATTENQVGEEKHNGKLCKMVRKAVINSKYVNGFDKIFWIIMFFYLEELNAVEVTSFQSLKLCHSACS